MATPLRAHARSIWQAAVDAARPEPLVREALRDAPPALRAALDAAPHIFVVGGGKAGAAMSAGLEEALADRLDRVSGLVNVPAECVRPLKRVRLHPARPAGSNHPTAHGVAGSVQMLEMLRSAGPEDVALCLLSGGGSALLPAPADDVPLADKQEVTRLLHGCGATIGEMNAVRKHLSRIKGGRLAQAFTGRRLVSLIVSDVVGDRLDVIASGPTAADPTTFNDALEVLGRYELTERVPLSVRYHLERGAAGLVPETPKQLPAGVENVIIGSNALALSAAQARAEELGYRVINLGPFVEGETRHVAVALAGVALSARRHGWPARPPLCLLAGGETTVTLGPNPGKGGRNQEFALAALLHLEQAAGLAGLAVLSGGTDGEDGPTDAAGAVADETTVRNARRLGLRPEAHLARHDAYAFFQEAGELLRTGLTHTNVMDVRVLLVT